MTTPAAHEHDLVLTREFPVSPDKLYRCWTDPELMVKWFTPAPWKTVSVEADLRPGGGSVVVMEGPDGQRFPNPGIYLEVIPGRKLVFTDAYTAGWVPSAKPFMTAIVTFEDIGGGKTRYTAIARHWTAEDKAAHEQMGFHEGWGKAADQLLELARTL